MNALAIHLYLTIRYINLSFNYFGNFYRIIVNKSRQVLCDNAGMGAIDNFVYGDLCFIILRKNLQGLE